MHEWNYPPETVANLAHILVPEKDRKTLHSETLITCLAVTARMAAESVIPWNRRDEILTEEELIGHVKETVKNFIRPYRGSTIGYSSWQNSRWLLLGLLFGVGTADSLAHKERDVDVDVRYENGVWSLDIPGMKKLTDGQFYDVQTLRWCRRMAPNHVYDMPEETLMEIMLPAFRSVGRRRIDLPCEYPYTDSDFREIYQKALSSPLAKVPGYEWLTPDNAVCQLQWCLWNTSDEVLDLYMESCRWDDLCDSMKGDWEKYHEEVTL